MDDDSDRSQDRRYILFAVGLVRRSLRHFRGLGLVDPAADVGVHLCRLLFPERVRLLGDTNEQIALALAEAFECGVNDLPLSLVISWFEQKAAAVLLTLPAGSLKPGRYQVTVVGERAALEMNGEPAWEVSGLEAATGYIGLQAEVPSGGEFEFRR